MAAAHKIQQIVQKLRDIRGANVMLKMKLADSAAQVNPKIFVIEHSKIFMNALQHIEAIVVKGGSVHLLASQQLAYAFAHLVGGISRVGERENLVRISVAFPHQTLDAMRQDGSFPGARAGYDQHGSVNVLNGFTLSIIRSERDRTGVRLRRRHWQQDNT